MPTVDRVDVHTPVEGNENPAQQAVDHGFSVSESRRNLPPPSGKQQVQPHKNQGPDDPLGQDIDRVYLGQKAPENGQDSPQHIAPGHCHQPQGFLLLHRQPPLFSLFFILSPQTQPCQSELSRPDFSVQNRSCRKKLQPFHKTAFLRFPVSNKKLTSFLLTFPLPCYNMKLTS